MAASSPNCPRRCGGWKRAARSDASWSGLGERRRSDTSRLRKNPGQTGSVHSTGFDFIDSRFAVRDRPSRCRFFRSRLERVPERELDLPVAAETPTAGMVVRLLPNVAGAVVVDPGFEYCGVLKTLNISARNWTFCDSLNLKFLNSEKSQL